MRGELEVRIAEELLERARSEGMSLVGRGGRISEVRGALGWVCWRVRSRGDQSTAWCEWL